MDTTPTIPAARMFLTSEQVFELTGYQMKSKQVKWLRDNGVHFFVARDGSPRVLPSALEPNTAPRRRAEPNFEALKEFNRRPPKGK